MSARPDTAPDIAPDTAPDTAEAAAATCVLPLPPGLTDAVHALAAAAGTDDLAVLAVCAGVLVARLPHVGEQARVVAGGGETTVGAAGRADLSDGLGDALRRAARGRGPVAAAGRPVAVTFRVAAGGRDLHVRSVPDTGTIHSAEPWGRALVALLANAVAEPAAPLGGLPLVDATERDRILHGLNPHRTPRTRYTTMAQPFEEQVGRSPDAVALVDEDGATVSYRELDERANRMAHHLRALGAGPGTRVGICMRRGAHQIVAVYAAVKAGATYVPVDAQLPDQRIAYVLADTRPRLVLTDPHCRPRLPAGRWEVVDVSADAAWAHRPATTPDVAASARGVVHILYTSGTTGRPKGVATTTGAALANVAWMQRQYPFGPGDTTLFKASTGFDISIWEIFWPLHHGARVVLCRPGAERDPRHLARLTAAFDATMLFLVPTMMPAFLDELSTTGARSLRWMVCGGEPMSPRIPQAFQAAVPAGTLVNAFGPTEAGSVTDNVIGRDTGGGPDGGTDGGTDGVHVPVGRPADNFRVTLLDADLDLVPVGVPGEAYISGEVGLADGYWRAPAQTAERFVADPYGPPGARMYRTGDLCRYRADGRLEHLGRIDRQLKIRGQRVEPGEIESVLAAHPAVGDCAVVAHGRPARLLAFVVPVGDPAAGELDPAAVTEHAALHLPVHMRPEHVVPVERLPATVNGKIDHVALVAEWQSAVAAARRVVLPADDVEAALVEIYGRLLQTDTVSVLDTFVSLGGHSLLSITLLDECTAALHAAPDVTDVMTRTLREVATTLRGGAHPV